MNRGPFLHHQQQRWTSKYQSGFWLDKMNCAEKTAGKRGWPDLWVGPWRMSRIFPESRERGRHFRKGKELRQRPGDEVHGLIFTFLRAVDHFSRWFLFSAQLCAWAASCPELPDRLAAAGVGGFLPVQVPGGLMRQLWRPEDIFGQLTSWFCSVQHVERWTRVPWVKPLLGK